MHGFLSSGISLAFNPHFIQIPATRVVRVPRPTITIILLFTIIQRSLLLTPLKVTILNISLNMQTNYQRFMTFVILQALGHPCCCRPNLRLHNIIYIFWSFWLMSMSRLLDAFTNTGFQKFLKIFFFWMNNGKFSISKFILPGKVIKCFPFYTGI